MMYLGIDPGHDGGAVLLGEDGRTVRFACGWRRMGRKAGPVYRVSVYGGQTFELRDLARLGTFLCDRVALEVEARDSLRLTVEGIFASRSWVTAVTLGEVAGTLYGPSLTLLGDQELHLLTAHGSILRPKPMVWRKAILGNGGLTSVASEALALEWCRNGTLVDGLQDLDNPHVAEAACIARYGHALPRIGEGNCKNFSPT